MDAAPGSRRPRLNFAGQTLLLQLAVVTLVALVAAGVHGWLTYQRLGFEAQHRALSVARTLATTEQVRAEAARLTAADAAAMRPAELLDEPLVPLAHDVRARTDALFVVITDDEGIRLTHPDAERLGERVSTDPSGPLSGEEVTNTTRGTLGLSARAKVPIYAPGSQETVVGEVSVGFAMDDVLQDLSSDITPVALTGVGALGLGVVASWLLVRRLRRLTLGLEPEDLTALAQDQEAVLRGVDEGVIGVSAEGALTVVNAEARRLLDLAEDDEIVGHRLEDSPLPPSVVRLAAEAGPETPSTEAVIGSRVLILTARPVRAGGLRGTGEQNLGTVIMLRDRTRMQALTRQLQAVSSMTTALRAQRHEFANRLHTIAGLLGIGNHAEAEDYVGSLLATGPLKSPVEQAEQLADPYLQAFIGAKSVEAGERGVHLHVGEATLVRGRVEDPHDVTTVLGNLVDNAVHAAVHGAGPDRWVEVDLLDELEDDDVEAGAEVDAEPGTDDPSGTLHLVVADSGDGTADPEALFTEGYSTATTGPLDAHGQGLGLSICRQIARDRGGDVWLADPGRTGGPGAVFCARLPGTMSRRGPGGRGHPTAAEHPDPSETPGRPGEEQHE